MGTVRVGAGLEVELRPPLGWRVAWGLRVELGDGVASCELGPSARRGRLVPPAAGDYPLRVRPWIRSQRVSLAPPLPGAEPVLLADPTWERHSRQSTLGDWGPDTPRAARAWGLPTRAEDAPWYEIDLAQPLYVEAIRLHWANGAGPPGPVELHAYPRLGPGGEPWFAEEAWHEAVESPQGPHLDVRPRAVARYLRVTLHPEQPAALELAGVEVLAATLTAATLLESMQRAFTLFAHRPLFGCREREPDGALSGYRRWTPYGAVWAHARQLAAGLRDLLAEAPRGPEGRVFVGICAPNQPEWACADLACLLDAFVVVPLPATDPPERLRVLAERCGLACVFAGREQIPGLQAVAAEVPSLQALIELPPLDRSPPPGPLPGALAYGDVVARGDALLDVFVPAPRGPDELHTVLFSSGSTGMPKGAMRSYSASNAMLTAFGVSIPAVHLSFQPLSHFSERVYQLTLFVYGGQIGFASAQGASPSPPSPRGEAARAHPQRVAGGGSRLFEDLAWLEPTAVGGPPRVFNKLLDRYRQDLAQLRAARPEADLASLEAEALAGLRGVFGGRLQNVSVGSAPPSQALMEFLQRCFHDCRVGEGYGSTECATITVDDHVHAGVDLRLIDVPELGYFTGDDPPRGEILVRTPHMVSGYLGDEAATRATFDEAGYFHTGDLGERQPDGRVRVIGRRKSVVKLAQGEFVAPERIEDALLASPLVAQLVIHADSQRSSVVGLVVPNRGPLALELGCAEGDLEALAGEAASARVLADLRRVGRAAQLLPWELPSAIHLELEPLSVERGLATSSNKVDRRAVAARYAEVFAALYEGATPRQGVLDLVREAAAAVLGEASFDSDLAGRLGVDSLSGVELVSAVSQKLGREVSLAAWHGASSLEELARRIQVEAGVGVSAAGGESATAAQARADLAAPLELDPGVLAQAPAHPARWVLLTGATGFLGAHLLEALLGLEGVEVRALVRAADDAAASTRLHEAVARYGLACDPADAQALAGDLAQPRLGWSEARWAEQASELDAILHAGAQVNWLMLYGQLRAANVGGTDALLALAASVRPKALHFVSTISTVDPAGDEGDVLPEDRALKSSGYGLSKWVAEQRVRLAAAAGLATTIHRPAMITGHSARGVANPEDFVNRYLQSCLELGVGLDLEEARCDLTPVDFVARAILALIRGEAPAGQVSHLTNLDRSPTWVELSRGLEVDPVPYSDFRAALLAAGDALPLAPLRAWFPAAGFGMRMGPWPHAATAARLQALGCPLPPPAATLMEVYRAHWAQGG